ncbi:glycosyltransferase [Citrifermentans bremense]|uniref:glycosyltransferase n=1 Tax=Citrifermentans bremense TaxID=60035 RepID=UPI0004050E68|nr:glycosyltransferase [Citrifermentans bremense]
MNILFLIAVATLILVCLAGLEVVTGARRVRALRETDPGTATKLPPVSIVVAARNEERNIGEALQSLLDLDYPDYELIVVDDRSEDGTGAILEEMSRERERLRVIRVEHLPQGWLGKNHALWVGSRQARGEYLLFTDADIVMEPTVLTRGVIFMRKQSLDHLAATPSLRMPSLFLDMFGASFIIFFSLFSRPWKARDPKSRCHIGIGAFNMLRADAYRSIGGHEAIRLRPDDDIKLGKLIKTAGLRQEAAYAPEYLFVEWYASVGEVVRGLEKNAFAGTDYSVPLVLTGVFGQSVCGIWPFLAIFVTGGAVQALYLATVLVTLATVADSARFHRSHPWYAIAYPITSALFVYILMRTMLLNLWQGGIYWRGTFYPLQELKKNRI